MAENSIPKTSGIYKITCTANGKIYVGSANNLRQRLGQHRINLRGQYHENSYLQHAWNKYGESAFKFEIIELVMPWSLLDREQYWLDKLKPYDRNIGFNIALDAVAPARGRKVSEESRAKMSAARKGRRNSPEAIAKSVAANTGQKRSLKTRANISASLKGRILSPETISKSATSRTGLKRSLEANIKTGIANSKRYIVTTPNGDEFEVINLSKFCRENNLSDLANVACGRRSHCRGWKARRIK